MESFVFKQFTVSHTRSAMKVNTDGVLLAAWATLPNLDSNLKNSSINILDIGTGTGVISLIIAQRLSGIFPSFRIKGIDIDSLSIEDATFNFEQSPWSNQLECETISVQNYFTQSREHFSQIISNPPYFTNSFKSISQRRSAARHNDSLPLHSLIDAALQLLCEGGVLSLILPVQEGKDIMSICHNSPIYPIRLCAVKTTPEKIEKRYLLEFQKGDPIQSVKPKFIEEELIIQDKNGIYTDKYCNLVSDFYYKDLRGIRNIPI